VDVRLVEIDQQVPVARGTIEHRFEIVQESLALGRVGPAQQLLGFLPGQLQAMQRGADGLPTEPPAEALLDPVHQTAQRPTWRRRPLVVRWPSLLGVADHAAEGGLDRRAKGGRPPVRR
jgi:hypothetical protein